jgi:N-acetylmuramoyl-L-alanine amidase
MPECLCETARIGTHDSQKLNVQLNNINPVRMVSMKMPKIVVISRRIFLFAVACALILQIGLTWLVIHYTRTLVIEFTDPNNGIIVIDAGHGGIDGGTNRGDLLEKDVNLAIAQKLKGILEEKGYTVIMTRNDDVSLDDLNHSSSSRHKRDLNARVSIINSISAQLFVSIHVNSSGSSKADGSIVLYSQRFEQNEMLACCIQLALNSLTIDGENRTTHNPRKGDFYLLNNSDMPGVIVETAFISNAKEKKLLAEDEFRAQLASAISDGIEQYLSMH